MIRRRSQILAGTVGLLMVMCSQTMAQERQPSPLMGRQAPRIKARDLDGKERTLAEFRGKIIVLSLSASW